MLKSHFQPQSTPATQSVAGSPFLRGASGTREEAKSNKICSAEASRPCSSIILARLAVAVEARGEMGRIGADLLGQVMSCDAARDDLTCDRGRQSPQVIHKRLGGRIDHDPQRAQGMIVFRNRGQVRCVGLEAAHAAVASRRSLHAGLIQFDERFERTARERARDCPNFRISENGTVPFVASSPELQPDDLRLVARIPHENAAGRLPMMDGKRQARGRGGPDVDHVAAAPAQPFADGRREFGRDGTAVAGENNGGIRDWGLGIGGTERGRGGERERRREEGLARVFKSPPLLSPFSPQ